MDNSTLHKIKIVICSALRWFVKIFSVSSPMNMSSTVTKKRERTKRSISTKWKLLLREIKLKENPLLKWMKKKRININITAMTMTIKMVTNVAMIIKMALLVRVLKTFIRFQSTNKGKRKKKWKKIKMGTIIKGIIVKITSMKSISITMKDMITKVMIIIMKDMITKDIVIKDIVMRGTIMERILTVMKACQCKLQFYMPYVNIN